MKKEESFNGMPRQAERMMELMHHMKNIRIAELCPELSHAEVMLLHHLCCPDQELKPVQLSILTAHLHMQPAGVSRLMKSMEKEGLILRTTDPDNRRNILVQATEKGRNKAEECRCLFQSYWGEVFSRIPEEDWDSLYRIMETFTVEMEAVLTEMLKNNNKYTEEKKL